MNSNLFQTILTVLLTISGLATSVLVSLGCNDIGGSISCVASNAPTWMVPYLGIAASVLGILKLVIGAFTGKLTAPTAAVSKSGNVGTVSPSDVVK
jgi:hypothetical protein